MITLKASEFKAKCLAILDQVARTGQVVTIEKRGKPVARLGPALSRSGRHPQDDLKGTVQTIGDIIDPVLPAGAWEVESKHR